MDEIKLNLENLTEEERSQLMKLVEKGNRKSKKWKPKCDEKYWYVNAFGNIYSTICHIDTDEADIFAVLTNNCFATEAEAKEHKKVLEIQARWRQLAEESEEDDNPWDGEHRHWGCYYKITDSKIYSYCDFTEMFVNCCFSSEKALLAAIQEIGEENVKKYILGVKE